ncbi:hypothetical protein pb186bvf_012983 [Paramecium bursaria]
MSDQNLLYKLPDLSPGQCANCGCYDKYDGKKLGNGSYILAVILLPIALCWLPWVVKDCQNNIQRCQKCDIILTEQPFLC